ncbi:cytochrome c family protein [Sphingomonas sp. AOB5]|uniref:c-type cytochrome n=1 Tax=Sphingomonas sp. AOB5 TaxID=3034017 RepID=UPI0023F7C3B8|nr:cytochrome c family protein [Sphingomonas sp. AOB5]MDF7777441.1 cytochrome c family protein [Sphingomonas sp. AOB5]
MDDRTNTIAGWVLTGGIAALGLSIVSGMVFSSHAPEKPGYAVEGASTGPEEVTKDQPIAALLATADPVKGADVFKKCAACHTINQGGANGIGPNLWNAVGKPHGHVAGFAYSDALKGVPGNWDFDALDHWLKNPRKYAPGTKMTFAGLPNQQDRANLIVYLNQQGSNLPLPAAPAPGAAPAAEGNATEAAPAAGNEAAPAAEAKGH